LLIRKPIFKILLPPYASPATEVAGAYAMPPYYVCRSTDMSTGNTTLFRTGGYHKRPGAKARIAGDLKERSYKSPVGVLLSLFFNFSDSTVVLNLISASRAFSLKTANPPGMRDPWEGIPDQPDFGIPRYRGMVRVTQDSFVMR